MSSNQKQQKQQKKTLTAEETDADLLQLLDPYIMVQVHQFMSQHPSFFRQEVKDLEVDEIIQCVRIKFWLILKKRDIRSPHPYVKSIIRSVIIDMYRKHQGQTAFSIDESEEYQEMQSASDLEDSLVQQMDGASLLNTVVQLVLNLPPRQKLAMICLLQDQVDDPAQLIAAFKRYRFDIEAFQWPEEKAAKQLLKASLPAARRMLARNIKKYRLPPE